MIYADMVIYLQIEGLIIYASDYEFEFPIY